MGESLFSKWYWQHWTAACTINESGAHYQDMHKKKLKMDKDLNGSQDALKHLEGNIGKALSELNHTSIFSCQSPKAIEMKRKLIQWY